MSEVSNTFTAKTTLASPYSSQRSQSQRAKREHTHLGCQLKCLLTNKTRLISIHSYEHECLEGQSCEHGLPLPARRAEPPTEWKSDMTQSLVYIPVMIKRSAGNTVHPQDGLSNMLLENAKQTLPSYIKTLKHFHIFTGLT